MLLNLDHFNFNFLFSSRKLIYGAGITFEIPIIYVSFTTYEYADYGSQCWNIIAFMERAIHGTIRDNVYHVAYNSK